MPQWKPEKGWENLAPLPGLWITLKERSCLTPSVGLAESTVWLCRSLFLSPPFPASYENYFQILLCTPGSICWRTQHGERGQRRWWKACSWEAFTTWGKSYFWGLSSLVINKRTENDPLLDSLHLFTENTLTFAISVYLLAFSLVLIYFQIWAVKSTWTNFVTEICCRTDNYQRNLKAAAFCWNRKWRALQKNGVLLVMMHGAGMMGRGIT